MAAYVVTTHKISISRACRTISLSTAFANSTDTNTFTTARNCKTNWEAHGLMDNMTKGLDFMIPVIARWKHPLLYKD